MSEPKQIGELLTAIAANPNNELSKVLRHCPVIQAQLMQKGIISFNDLTDEECNRLIEWDCKRHPDYQFLDNLIDSQDVMLKLHISPRTLQTLRSNGTIPHTRIGQKIWYLRSDIERILRNNYVMFNIRRYGKDN